MPEDEPRIAVTRLDRMVASMVQEQSRPILGRIYRLLLRLQGVDFLGTVGPGLVMPHSTTGCVIHPDAHLGRDVTVWHGVTVGRADVWKAAHPDTRVIVGDGVILGANCSVLVKAGKTLTLGEGAVIGSNAVVTHDIPSRETWAGNPARRVGSR